MLLSTYWYCNHYHDYTALKPKTSCQFKSKKLLTHRNNSELYTSEFHIYNCGITFTLFL